MRENVKGINNPLTESVDERTRISQLLLTTMMLSHRLFTPSGLSQQIIDLYGVMGINPTESGVIQRDGITIVRALDDFGNAKIGNGIMFTISTLGLGQTVFDSVGKCQVISAVSSFNALDVRTRPLR